MSKVGTCEMCGGHQIVTGIWKQLHGETKFILVCPDCYEEHLRDLEMTRQNFQRQFGDR